MLSIVIARNLMSPQPISFVNSRSDKIAGVLHHAADTRKGAAAILCHGMESNKNSAKLIFLAEQLAERGINTLRFDFSYVGESSGKFENITYSGEVEDLRAAFEWMRNRYSDKIGIFGSSMGGSVALMFAAQEPAVAALVALAAPIHPENFPKRVLPLAGLERWRQRGYIVFNGLRLKISLLEDLEQIDIVGAARTIQCPVLILHGDADEVVPVTEAYELHDCLSCSKRLLILNGGDHRLSDPSLMDRALREGLDWLADRLH
jgi:uncharacterized protein